MPSFNPSLSFIDSHVTVGFLLPRRITLTVMTTNRSVLMKSSFLHLSTVADNFPKRVVYVQSLFHYSHYSVPTYLRESLESIITTFLKVYNPTFRRWRNSLPSLYKFYTLRNFNVASFFYEYVVLRGQHIVVLPLSPYICQKTVLPS